MAQTAGNGGDALSAEPRVMLVGCDGGRAMISSDGGSSWKLLDPFAADQARRELQAISPLRRTVADRAATRTATAAPNPTSGPTEIRYSIAEAEPVMITLHSTAGVEVLRSSDQPRHSGEQITMIDASALASGSYFFRVRGTSGRVVGEGTLAIAR